MHAERVVVDTAQIPAPVNPPLTVINATPQNEAHAPRVLRGFVWDEGASLTPITPSASLTESMDPIHGPPDNELQNAIALKTIHDHPNLFSIITPIRIDRLEYLLRTHPNRPLVISVLNGFRLGFWPFADIAHLTYPDTWDEPNRPMSAEKEAFVAEQIAEEERLQRYSPPFGPDLLPGMFSMPLGVVPKPHSDKFRLVNDFSAGEFSLNALVDRSSVHFRPDRVQDLGRNLLHYRLHHPTTLLWLFKSDVSQAYRRIPMHPLWQIKQIISFRGQRRVDRCNCFGGRGSGKLWCIFMALVLWIAIYVQHIDLLLAYVDDTFSYDDCKTLILYEPYGEYFPAKQVRLLLLWDDLGIPHDRPKQLYGRSLLITGFVVDPRVMTIQLEDESKDTLVMAIFDFLRAPASRRRRTLREWQSLLGWINWGLNVLPLAKPGLSSSYRKIAGKNFPHAPIYINAVVTRDLLWVAESFKRFSGVHMLRARNWPVSSANLTIFCDAALTGGLAFWVPSMNLGFVSSLPPAPPCADTIFWYEALTVLSALSWAATRNERPSRLLIHTDNLNTVQIFDSFIADEGYNDILLSACRILMDTDIDLRVFHIPGDQNVIADALSRHLFHVVRQYTPNLSIQTFQPPHIAMGAAEK